MNSPPQQPPPRHHITTTEVVPPIVGAAVTFSLLTLLLFIYRRLKHSISSTSPSHQLNHHLRRYSYSSLRRATSSFDSSRRLGRGGFGSVYSAKLKNRHVAVKVMDSRSLQGEREFHNEIRLAEHLVDSDRVVKLLGYAAAPRSRKLCLIYEIMSNGNLQDCLLRKKLEQMMTWSARYCVAVDIAKGLMFLHHECDPVIIHGDVKASNVLLDDNFVAKIADFGLARVKMSDNFDNNVVNCDNNDVVIDVNDSGSVLETESVGTTTLGFEETEISPENLDKESDLEAGIESGKVEKSVEGSVRGLGKDWRRKRENGGGRETVKEYVMEWMGMDVVKEKTGNDLNVVGVGEGEGAGTSSLGVKEADKEKGKKKLKWWRKREDGRGEGEETVKEYVMEWMGMDVVKEKTGSELNVGVVGGGSSSSLGVKKTEKKKGKKKMEWWMLMDDVKMSKKEKRRPVREWWKEEYSEELAKKNKKKKKREEGTSDHDENWWPRDDETRFDKNSNKSRSRMSRMSSRSRVDWWLDGLSGDHWKVRHASFDSMSGEIVPKSGGGISSTPSMRGTVCYIAPEYSMGGDLSEKCDVYSFGVVMLVLIAGRRPLQVTGSPMSEFHKANLLSWARQLARSGKLLDLVDDKISSLNKEQAELCIIIALSCLQKVPARRPSMKDVVGMLTGELPPPVLPVEFSPSHASKYPHRSRKKLR